MALRREHAFAVQTSKESHARKPSKRTAIREFAQQKRLWNSASTVFELEGEDHCYTGDSHDQIKRHYFRVVMPTALPQLERQLSTVGTGLLQEETRCEDESDKSGSVSDEGGVYFAGGRASYGDVNVFHMLNNAMLLEPELLARTPLLEDWYWRVAELECIKQYLIKVNFAVEKI